LHSCCLPKVFCRVPRKYSVPFGFLIPNQRRGMKRLLRIKITPHMSSQLFFTLMEFCFPFLEPLLTHLCTLFAIMANLGKIAMQTLDLVWPEYHRRKKIIELCVCVVYVCANKCQQPFFRAMFIYSS
jgi:hypothetical protein